MAAKLTEIIKKEMLEGFSEGKSFASISKEYGCTPSTVTRAVKSFLTDEEFARLKSQRCKSNPLKKEVGNDSENQNDLMKTTPIGALENPTVLVDDKLKNIDQTELVSSVISNNAETFTEIIPLGIEPFFEEQREVACKPL